MALRSLFALAAVSLVSGIIIWSIQPKSTSSIQDSPVESNTEHSIGEDSGIALRENAQISPPDDLSREIAAEQFDLSKEIVQSVYDIDIDSRTAAIGAVEKEALQLQLDFPDALVRWQPVWINAFKITNGAYLDENTVEREFRISPFPDRSYLATRTIFRPRESIASASWQGELDGGKSGKIEMSILASEDGPVLFIKLRTPDGQFNIRPTDIYGAYIVSEANEAFWRTQGPVQ